MLEAREMLPTGRDIEYMAEIRRSKGREADRYRLYKLTKNDLDQSKFQIILRRLGQTLSERMDESSDTVVCNLPETRLSESS